MGFDYLYVADGNDVEAMIEAFSRVRDIDHPIVLHINTLKGKGYRFAECQKERFHWSMPFDIHTGELKKPAGDKGYDTLTAEHLLSLMEADRTVVGITAGTPAVFGFTKDRRERAGKQFIDMGIAEEQAVAMASALAKGGAKPVFGVYSTFIQRAYDQLSQDLCINNNPATILVFGQPRRDERRDTPLSVRHPADFKHPEYGLPCAYMPRGISGNARLEHPAD